MERVVRSMAALKEKTANMATNVAPPAGGKQASPNTSRKRKSGEFDADKENEGAAEEPAQAPPSKRAKSTTTKKQPATKATTTKAKTASSSSSKKAPTKKEQKEAELAKYDVSQIYLDGEDAGTVPVFDTCNDVRTKLNAHMRTAPTSISSVAALVRELAKCIPGGQRVEGISSASLKKFIGKKGPNAGATMPSFYAAYVYFEKLRIKGKKNKTKKREEMEEVWGINGMRLDADEHTRFFTSSDRRPTIDKYDKIGFGGF